MATVEIPITQLASSYPGAGVAWVFVPANPALGNHYLATGRETLLARNTSGDTAYVLTIDSIADELGRTREIETSIPAGGMVAYKLAVRGYVDPTTRRATMTAANAAIELAALRDPN